MPQVDTQNLTTKTDLSKALRQQSGIARVRATNREARRGLAGHQDTEVRLFAHTWKRLWKTGRVSGVVQLNVHSMTAGELLDFAAGAVARLRKQDLTASTARMRDCILDECRAQNLFTARS